METEKKLFSLISTSREDTRRQVVFQFLEERCGTGKGDNASKYDYHVESYESYEVVLKRPATFNYGFDFTVTTPNIAYKPKKKKTNRPSHDDVVNILSQVKNEVGDPKFQEIKELIWNIFDLSDFDIHIVDGITFRDANNEEKPLGILILAIRWLFIEQDLTYWNWSGRHMLMNKLLEHGLVTTKLSC